MSDPPGVPSALGIEAVECFPEGESLTVRVTGRWRRRRPDFRGQAMLVIEAQGTRHRFPAMPEPPSLVGALPGTWRMSFSVPVELGPFLGERAWLALGAVVVPLPVTVEARQPEQPTRLADSETVATGQLQGSEVAVEAARRRALEAETQAAEMAARVESLERDLEELRQEPEQLRAMLRGRERERRIAEQRAHAERARRVEAEEELSELEQTQEASEEALAEIHALEGRVRELERELERVRRAADEAEHMAAAATAARARAETQLRERVAAIEAPASAPEEHPSPPPQQISPLIRAERLLAKGSSEPSVSEQAAGRAASRRAEADAHEDPTAHLEQAMILARAAPVRDLQLEARVAELSGELEGARRELGTTREEMERVRAELDSARQEAGGAHQQVERARRETTEAREESARLHEESARVHEELQHEREQAAGLREELERERTTRTQAQERAALLEGELSELRGRSERASAAIEALRGELQELMSEAEPQATATPEGTGAVEAERLSAALARLRESAEADRPEPSTQPERVPSGTDLSATRKRWLPRVFRRLAAEDPTTAGRLLLALLPAQGEVQPLPLAYDLILGELASVQVTVGNAGAEVRFRDEPRAPEQVHFQVRGDLSRLARLLAAGRLRRRFGRRRAKVSGERERVIALRKLVDAPLSLAELHAAGVRLDPGLALTVVSLMLEPKWTAGERFTIAHQGSEAPAPSAYLQIRDGSAPIVSGDAPHGQIATTIVSAPDMLLPALSGSSAEEIFVRGDPRPLAVLQQWLVRAQSG